MRPFNRTTAAYWSPRSLRGLGKFWRYLFRTARICIYIYMYISILCMCLNINIYMSIHEWYTYTDTAGASWKGSEPGSFVFWWFFCLAQKDFADEVAWSHCHAALMETVYEQITLKMFGLSIKRTNLVSIPTSSPNSEEISKFPAWISEVRSQQHLFRDDLAGHSIFDVHQRCEPLGASSGWGCQRGSDGVGCTWHSWIMFGNFLKMG